MKGVYVINTIAYVAEKSLGKGAFGSVHLVHSFKTKKKQAIKVQKTTRHASAQMKISHLFVESLVAHDRENTYIVLPFYDISLASWYARHVRHGGDEASIIRTFRKASESLQAVHEKGYVHLDIKSNNIMMSEDGTVTVIDFGRTKQIGEFDDGFGLQFDPKHYLPPEIMMSTSFTVDTSNDVWSLGQMFKSTTASHPLSMPDFHTLTKSMLAVSQTQRPALFEVIASLRKIEASLRKTHHALRAIAPRPHPPMPAVGAMMLPPAPLQFCPPCVPQPQPQMMQMKRQHWFGNWL